MQFYLIEEDDCMNSAVSDISLVTEGSFKEYFSVFTQKKKN